jgi:glutaredoxin 3
MKTVAEVEIYTTPWCPYCVAAKELLAARRIAYREIDVSTDPERRAEARARSGRHTVPQILIDGEAIGGYADLARLDAEGDLAGLVHEQA